jgi:hypothetical protein
MKTVFGLGLVLLFSRISISGVPDSGTASNFHADANVALIDATVHDRPVRGLTRDDFRVFDDKAQQRIAYFAEEEAPLTCHRLLMSAAA